MQIPIAAIVGLPRGMDPEIEQRVSQGWVFDWHSDPRKGLHCANCGEEEPRNLLSNSRIRYVLCIRCLCLIAMRNGRLGE